MTTDQSTEYADLIHKFNCSDITPEQMKRLTELHTLQKLTEACQEAFEYIDGIYDGAPDSPTRNLGGLLEKLRSALA